MSKFENGLLSSAAVNVEKDINAAVQTVVEETEAFSLSIRRSAGLVSIKEDGMVCEISASLSHTFGSAERFDLISAAVDRHVYPLSSLSFYRAVKPNFVCATRAAKFSGPD